MTNSIQSLVSQPSRQRVDLTASAQPKASAVKPAAPRAAEAMADMKPAAAANPPNVGGNVDTKA